jgi:hypothetical protein
MIPITYAIQKEHNKLQREFDTPATRPKNSGV